MESNSFPSPFIKLLLDVYVHLFINKCLSVALTDNIFFSRNRENEHHHYLIFIGWVKLIFSHAFSSAIAIDRTWSKPSGLKEVLTFTSRASIHDKSVELYQRNLVIIESYMWLRYLLWGL